MFIYTNVYVSAIKGNSTEHTCLSTQQIAVGAGYFAEEGKGWRRRRNRGAISTTQELHTNLQLPTNLFIKYAFLKCKDWVREEDNDHFYKLGYQSSNAVAVV